MTPDSFTQELLRHARAQTDLLSSEFIAPIKAGCNVIVRLAGQWCSMMIVPASFEGWGVCRPLSPTVALCCRPATSAERAEYVSLFAGIPCIKGEARSGLAGGRFGGLYFAGDRLESGGSSSGTLGICLMSGNGRLDPGFLNGFGHNHGVDHERRN
jgi:hypothetical protein